MTQTLLPTKLEFRTLAADELRTADTVFREAVHDKPASDETWNIMVRAFDQARTYGAFDGPRMVGTASSFQSSLTVPGGRILPMAAVINVGVRTDHRRRGALTGLMREQLADVAAAGEVFAGLHASEPVIYGRFGYGVATQSRIMRVQCREAELRPEVPVAGAVRLLDTDEVLSVLPAAYSRLLGLRVGMMARAAQWWVLGYERRLKTRYLLVAAHYDAEGTVDGWVAYRPIDGNSEDPRVGPCLEVLDFMAANQGVANDLWRYLIGVDLIEKVTAYARPLDDPLEAMLVYAHAAHTEYDDELWLRLVDVPAALAGRAYGDADPVVVEVVDPLLPANSGRYRISPQGTERTDAAAALVVSAEVLAMLYLGTWRPSTLAGIGRLEAVAPAALPAADRLFAADRPACCGTMF